MVEIKDGLYEHDNDWLHDNDWHCSQDDFKNRCVNSCLVRVDDNC